MIWGNQKWKGAIPILRRRLDKIRSVASGAVWVGVVEGRAIIIAMIVIELTLWIRKYFVITSDEFREDAIIGIILIRLNSMNTHNRIQLVLEMTKIVDKIRAVKNTINLGDVVGLFII